MTLANLPKIIRMILDISLIVKEKCWGIWGKSVGED
jgi:hypothetical protein